MTLPFTVILPLPDVKLTPNGRAMHWEKAKLVKVARHAAEIAGRNERIRIQLAEPLPPPVYVSLTFVFKTERRRDEDNLAAGMKHYFDGLVDAKVLRDDRREMLHVMLPLKVRIASKGEQPHLEIRLTPAYLLSPLAQYLIDTIGSLDSLEGA